jgi:outer membrane protein assembly factor BamB
MSDTTHPLIAVHGMTVRALDRLTGRLLWEYSANLNVARFTLTNGRVFALDDNCRVHCLDVTTGAALGVVQIDRVERTGCALVADGTLLYAATTKSIVAIDSSGQIAWRAEVGGAFGARAGLGLPNNVMQPDFTGS